MIIFNFLYEFLWGKIVILTASNIYNKRKKIFNVVVNASLVRSFRLSLLDVAPCLLFYFILFYFFFGWGGGGVVYFSRETRKEQGIDELSFYSPRGRIRS